MEKLLKEIHINFILDTGITTNTLWAEIQQEWFIKYLAEQLIENTVLKIKR